MHARSALFDVFGDLLAGREHRATVGALIQLLEPVGIAVPADDAQLLNMLENYLDALEGMGFMGELRKVWMKDGAWIAALP